MPSFLPFVYSLFKRGYLMSCLFNRKAKQIVLFLLICSFSPAIFKLATMIGALVIVSLTLASTVASSPVPDAPKPVAIPFRKRSLPLSINGVINPSALAAHMARVQAYVPHLLSFQYA